VQGTGLIGRTSRNSQCHWPLIAHLLTLSHELHAFGLLNNSFQPTDEIRIARTLWRQRSNLVAEASSVIQRMQKVLTEMNVQLSNVLSDLSGLSGMKIIGPFWKESVIPGNWPHLLNPRCRPRRRILPRAWRGTGERNYCLC